MSIKSNNQGRAYEFICLLTLENEIKKIRSVQIIHNSGYDAAKNSWDTLSNDEKTTYKISAIAAVNQIFKLEPRIVEDGDDVLELLIQQDSHGKEGDVRDILIVRRNITWEIGLSLKHNHFAVKHSRLSKFLDFGQSWYGIPCSEKYWDDIRPIFDYLSVEKEKHTKFSELPNKERDVYVPILNAFIDEVLRQNEVHSDIPSKMVEYLLGKFDFYKVISIDNKRTTQIQGFNLHGTLNQVGKNDNPIEEVPIVSLPKRIVKMEIAPGSSNTIELYLDGGWQFSFRIHNAETYVIPTLKFDIQIIGMPATIVTINCIWN